MSDEGAAVCPFCDSRALLRTGVSRYRRGGRSVEVKTQYWECGSGCPGPDGEVPFQFHDIGLLRANDEMARTAWRYAFGEEMPASPRWA